MGEVKNIETYYNGFRFRSRLEARWAVFFDAASIKYEYEPQGFEIDDGTRYLPDFYLPDYGWYAEVKAPRDGIDDELNKALKFIGNGIDVLLLLGNIPQKTKFPVWHFRALYSNPLYKRTMLSSVCFAICHMQVPATGCFIYGHAIDRKFETMHWFFTKESAEKSITAKLDKEMYDQAGEEFSYTESLDEDDYELLDQFYLKARTARFEHGETPSESKAPANREKAQLRKKLLKLRLEISNCHDESKLSSMMNDYQITKMELGAL